PFFSPTTEYCPGFTLTNLLACPSASDMDVSCVPIPSMLTVTPLSARPVCLSFTTICRFFCATDWTISSYCGVATVSTTLVGAPNGTFRPTPACTDLCGVALRSNTSL